MARSPNGTASLRVAWGVAFCAALARTATAEGTPDARGSARAEELFRQGTQKLDTGDVDTACAELMESLRLDSTLGTLLNVALCHEKQGKTATAWLEYTTSAAWAAEAGRADRRDFAHERAHALERDMPRVQLDLRGVSQSTVEVDGRPLSEGRLYLPLFLDPGEHTIVVRSPGKKPYVRAVPIVASAAGRASHPVQVIIVTPLADGAPVKPEGRAAEEPLPSVTPLEHETPSTTTRAALGLGVVGLVAVGVGGYFGVRSIADVGDLGPHCAGASCDAAGLSLRNQARAFETTSMVSLATGATTLVVGAWLWFTPKASPVSGVRIVPLASAHGGGVRAALSW